MRPPCSDGEADGIRHKTWGAKARKVFTMAISDGKQAVHHMREEISMLLRTELQRMPDVRSLIQTHLSSLESLQVLLLSKMPSLPSHVREHLASLPDVHDFVHRHVEMVPEWRAHLQEHCPSFLQNPTLLPSNIAATLSALFRRGMPSMLACKIHAIPSVSAAIASALSSTDEMLLLLQSSMDHDPVLRDVSQLVLSHYDRLPHLQDALKQQYQSWRPRLIDFHALPHWLQDNDHLKAGHRPPLLSFRRCFLSLFYVHSETGNIYTHALGALLFLVLGVYCAGFALHERPVMDRITFAGFCLSALLCLGCSAVFHCCLCHSYPMNLFFSRLDYAGITFLIFGSVSSFLYFLLYCHSDLLILYNIIMIGLGACCAYVSLAESFSKASLRWLRVLLFTGLALFGTVPVFHYYVLYGSELISITADLTWILGISGSLYVLGSVIFLARFPECVLPGRFDLWFHSHQLWHVCIVFAAAAHFVGVYNMLEHRLEHQCAAEQGLFTSALRA